MKCSASVRFFSLFIVILMWLISLAVFVIAINFSVNSSLELAYDVPALAIGLLFAIPFVRGVQPNVPDVGITIDIMGFFFNMILIAVAAILSLGAVASRYVRATRSKEATLAACVELGAVGQQPSLRYSGADMAANTPLATFSHLPSHAMITTNPLALMSPCPQDAKLQLPGSFHEDGETVETGSRIEGECEAKKDDTAGREALLKDEHVATDDQVVGASSSEPIVCPVVITGPSSTVLPQT